MRMLNLVFFGIDLIFIRKMNLGLSQETDSLMVVMQTPINGAINSATNDRVILEIQNIVERLTLKENIFGTVTSTCHQGLGDRPDGSQTNLT